MKNLLANSYHLILMITSSYVVKTSATKLSLYRTSAAIPDNHARQTVSIFKLLLKLLLFLFLQLIRFFVKETFNFLKKSGWDERYIKCYNYKVI